MKWKLSRQIRKDKGDYFLLSDPFLLYSIFCSLSLVGYFALQILLLCLVIIINNEQVLLCRASLSLSPFVYLFVSLSLSLFLFLSFSTFWFVCCKFFFPCLTYCSLNVITTN